MPRFLAAALLILSASLVGCGGTPSYPEPASTPEMKQQIEAHDKSVDEQERNRPKDS